jgi:transcriptional regulator with XRE-family HTH domain
LAFRAESHSGSSRSRRNQEIEEEEDVSEDAWTRQMAALGAFIRTQRAMASLSLRELAERTDVSNAYLSQIERGLHEPSIRVLHSIAAALGVPLDLLLAHAGLLGGLPPGGDPAPSEPPTGRDTEAAILSDPKLSGPQKFSLLSIYRSFVGVG